MADTDNVVADTDTFVVDTVVALVAEAEVPVVSDEFCEARLKAAR